MKKVISLLLVLVLCFSLCACGGESPSPVEVQLKTKTEYIFIHYPDKEQYSQTEINNVITTIYEYDESNQLVVSFTDSNSSERMGYKETYSYEDLMVYKTELACREAGKIRQEGRSQRGNCQEAISGDPRYYQHFSGGLPERLNIDNCRRKTPTD